LQPTPTIESLNSVCNSGQSIDIFSERRSNPPKRVRQKIAAYKEAAKFSFGELAVRAKPKSDGREGEKEKKEEESDKDKEMLD
jgi:hypothetical protein